MTAFRVTRLSSNLYLEYSELFRHFASRVPLNLFIRLPIPLRPVNSVTVLPGEALLPRLLLEFRHPGTLVP